MDNSKKMSIEELLKMVSAAEAEKKKQSGWANIGEGFGALTDQFANSTKFAASLSGFGLSVLNSGTVFGYEGIAAMFKESLGIVLTNPAMLQDPDFVDRVLNLRAQKRISDIPENERKNYILL